jgi:RNA polymerase sigma-70 factor (ECF subfamily)
MDEAEFDQMLRAAQAGGRAAVAALYQHFNPMLVRFLRTRAPGMGEDLAHDTWLAASPKLPEFHGTVRAFRMWLLSLAQAQAAAQDGTSSWLHITTVDPHRLASITPGRETEDARVADAAIAHLLAGLSPIHAEILWLRLVGSLTADETGALVGKSPGTVRVIQHRAVQKLAKRLSDERVAQ